MFTDDEDDTEQLLKKATAAQKDKKNSQTNAILAAINTLTEAVEDITEVQKKATFYDKDLASSLDKSLSKLAEVMEQVSKSQKIDLDPITKANEVLVKASEKNVQSIVSVMVSLEEQNKEMIKILSGLQNQPKEVPKDDSKLEGALTSLARAVISNNEKLGERMKSLIEAIKPIPPKESEPVTWVHQIHYSRGKMDFVESTPK